MGFSFQTTLVCWPVESSAQIPLGFAVLWPEGSAQLCSWSAAPCLVELSRCDGKTTPHVFHREELCRALLQCLSPESGLKIAFGLSCACSPGLNLLPGFGAQPWIHFTEAGIPTPSCAEPVLGFPALLRSSLLSCQDDYLPAACSASHWSTSSHSRAGLGETKAELAERVTRHSLMGQLSADRKEGRQSSRNLSFPTP